MKKLIVIILLIALAIGGYVYTSTSYVENLKCVDAENTEIVEIVIPNGSSTTSISHILYLEGLIRNAGSFKKYVQSAGLDSLLRAGTYEISKNMNVAEITIALTKNGVDTLTQNFSISPGVTSELTASQLAEQLNLNENILLEYINDASVFRDEFKFLSDNSDIETLQGYLLPNTYNVYKGLNEKEILEFILGQFEFWYESVLPLDETTDLSLKELVTLASIVEKEAGNEDEKPLVASVFSNRLNIDMPLQSCATVNYISGEWKDHLSTEDISVDDPYNTYIHSGLTPGPINSPSISSIEAALNPVETEYLYFLAKGDGTSYFSGTYEEHLKAKAKYIDN